MSSGALLRPLRSSVVGSVSTVAKHVTTVSRRRQKSNNSVSTEQPDTARNEAVLYVHWPYCARRCTYCNFNKYISANVDHRRMSEALCREAETLMQLSGITHINSIFFGGGTPSLALPSTISNLIEKIRTMVDFNSMSEVTLEANPTKLEAERLVEFQQAGVNRASLGIQALSSSDLLILGRDHSVDEALSCIEEAKKLYPGRVSIDLIFGRPGQTIDGWKQELKQILEICDNHLSLYQLTLERGTQLFKWVQEKRYTLPDSDAMADMYETAIDMLEEANLLQYEISNFSRKGSESIHNQAYWQGSQYIGIGPGAHGRFFLRNRPGTGANLREARIQTLEPPNWLFEVEKYGHATRKIVVQSVQDQLEEVISLGLRTVEGVLTSRWESLSIDSLETVFGENQMVRSLIENDYLVFDQNGIRATRKGLIVLDSIIPHLLVAMSNWRDR